MMHRYIFLYVINNKHLRAPRHSPRIHTPRGSESHTGPGSQRYIQQHEPLHTRSHQTETKGDREMSESKKEKALKYLDDLMNELNSLGLNPETSELNKFITNTIKKAQQLTKTLPSPLLE